MRQNATQTLLINSLKQRPDETRAKDPFWPRVHCARPARSTEVIRGAGGERQAQRSEVAVGAVRHRTEALRLEKTGSAMLQTYPIAFTLVEGPIRRAPPPRNAAALALFGSGSFNWSCGRLKYGIGEREDGSEAGWGVLWAQWRTGDGDAMLSWFCTKKPHAP